MKRKLFTLLLAVMTSMSIIASADVIPSNDVLAKYYEPGKVCVCIFVPGNMACGDFVLTGSFNGWASNVADCAYFEPVIGYDGWYVTSFEPEADPDVTRSIQALPVMLGNEGKFNWDYKAVAATKVRGGVEIGTLGSDLNIINFSVDMPNVFKIDALYKNPCTAIYHNYTVTVISDGCDGYAVPFLAGAMTSWEFKHMQMNIDKTMELGIGVYSYSFKAAEESLFQIVSGLMNEEGEVVEQPGWNNDSYLQKLVDGKWVRMPGEDSQNNLYTHENAEIVIDLREEDLRWARCNGEVAENVLVRLKAPAGAPESVEIIGSFDGWTGSAMTLNGGVWEAIVSAKPSALFKFRTGIGEDSDTKWSNQIQVFKDGNWEDMESLTFQDKWVQGEGDFADYKVVDLDFSNNELYKWHLEQPIVDENVVTLIPSQFTVGENQENFNETVSGITVEIYPKTTITTDQFRVFKNSTISISAEKEINRIVFTCTADDNAKYGPGCFESQDGYSYEGKVGTWAGTAATTIAFTASTNQVRITKIEVYFNSDVPSDPLVLAPSILPKFGDFLNSVEVELSCSTEGAKIYYTLDGTDPDANAILYNAPFILKESTLVRAIAILGENKSRVIEKNYNKVTPWTVEEAVSALKEFSPINNKFAKGIICQVDEWQNSWGSITYWISENGEVSDNNHMLEVYAGLGLNSEKFASIDALHVGDTVTIFGNLKIYRKEGKDDIYEFDQFSYLVKYKEVVFFNLSVISSDESKGNVIGGGSYLANETATIAAAPNTGYHFTQWSDGNTNNPRTITVTHDSVLTAEFDINKYQVWFYGLNNELIDQQSIEHGKAAVAPEDPVIEYYDFAGWDQDFSNVTSDLIVTAIYEEGQTIEMPLIFTQSTDGSEFKREKITFKLSKAPEIEGFTFVNWMVVAGELKDAIEIQAIYQYNGSDPTLAPAILANPSNPSQKLIRNGNVYILKSDRMYTLTGQEVK